MSKPQMKEYLKVESKRHQSYHIDEQGFQSTSINSFHHLPRSPSILTSDILEGFPVPPTNTTRRQSTLSPIPFRSSPSPPALMRRSSSSSQENKSNSNSLGNRPLLSLPTSQNLLLSNSLPERNVSTPLIYPVRRRSSIAEQEIPYHPSFSPTFSDTSSTNSSYFPPQASTSTRRPSLAPLYFPPRTFDMPSSPSPPPQIALPIIPAFLSVFIDPSNKFATSSTRTSPPPRSPASASITSGRSDNSTLEIVVPGSKKSSKGKSNLEEKSKDVHLSTLIGEEKLSENPFDDQSIVDGDRIDWKDGQKRRRKNASLASKWSFGNSNNQPLGIGYTKESRTGGQLKDRQEDTSRYRNTFKGFSSKSSDDFTTKRNSSKGLLATLRRKLSNKPLILIVVVVLVAVIVATIVGIHVSSLNSTQLGASTIGDCSCENEGQAQITSEGVCTCLCRDVWSGGYCQYNSTCVVPEGSIYPVAQGLLDVATSANSFFSPIVNSSRLALVINTYLNLPVASQCRSQLAIISLPNLPPSHFNRRATWSSAALLWSIANTETSATTLQSFITSKNFSQFGDFPSTTSNVDYQLEYYGYTFDLSTLQLSVPAVSWTSIASPDTSQASVMTSSSMQSRALDTMYSHSIAASTQRNLSLIHYWNELKLAPGDLQTFIDAVKSAPVIVPFDATATVAGLGMMDLANAQTSTSSFPPAPACIAAGLSRAQISQINSVEVGFFGLNALSSSEIDNTTCVDRPVYGMINLLSLRLPFLDSDTRSLPTQGLVLQESVKSRMIVHAGELLVGVSSNAPAPSPSTPSFPDHFGTFSNLDSVIFEYLQLLSPQVAVDLVNFVLAQSRPTTSPPSFPSSLYQNSNKLLSIPILEITIFGGLRYSDIDHSISSLSSGSNLHSNAFFGTPTAQEFRNWALAGPRLTGGTTLQGPILWSRGALEVTPVKEASLVNLGFEKVWSSSIGVTEDTVWNEISNL